MWGSGWGGWGGDPWGVNRGGVRRDYFTDAASKNSYYDTSQGNPDAYDKVVRGLSAPGSNLERWLGGQWDGLRGNFLTASEANKELSFTDWLTGADAVPGTPGTPGQPSYRYADHPSLASDPLAYEKSKQWQMRMPDMDRDPEGYRLWTIEGRALRGGTAGTAGTAGQPAQPGQLESLMQRYLGLSGWQQGKNPGTFSAGRYLNK